MYKKTKTGKNYNIKLFLSGMIVVANCVSTNHQRIAQKSFRRRKWI